MAYWHSAPRRERPKKNASHTGKKTLRLRMPAPGSFDDSGAQDIILPQNKTPHEEMQSLKG